MYKSRGLSDIDPSAMVNSAISQAQSNPIGVWAVVVFVGLFALVFNPKRR